MENKEHFELNDEELEKVSGGISTGDRVLVDTRMIRYCPNCSRLVTKFEGTVVGKTYYEKGGFYLIDVKSDCCGYIERAADFTCTVQ